MTTTSHEIRLIQKVVKFAGNQARAAEYLGLSQASVSRYLSGEIRPSLTVIILAVKILKYDT